LYNHLRQPNPNIKNTPGKEEVENFWREIYGKKVSHNEEACWIKDQCQHSPSMESSPICEKEVTEALQSTLSLKSPGRDQIPNFWLKQLTATHKHIAEIFNKLIEEDFIPEWLIPYTKKRVYWKSRPVTCLPMTYKFIISIISRCMQNIWILKIFYQKNRKGAAVEQKDAKTNC